VLVKVKMGYLYDLRFGTIFATDIIEFIGFRNRRYYAGMQMMDRTEKRRHRRLGANYNISCRKVGSAEERALDGLTANVSTGGLYFQTTAGAFEKGNLLKVELSIPPTSGLLEFGGKIAGFAKVLRTDSAGGRFGVALQFCRPPKLCI
jgi:hypothetical protein